MQATASLRNEAWSFFWKGGFDYTFSNDCNDGDLSTSSSIPNDIDKNEFREWMSIYEKLEIAVTLTDEEICSQVIQSEEELLDIKDDIDDTPHS